MLNQIDFLTLYQKIFNIIPQGSFQLLMNTVYEFLDVPILAVDVTYRVLGIAPNAKTGDANWDYLLEHHAFDTERTIQLYKDGVMQSANDRITPYLINWGGYNAHFPKIQGVIRVNNILEGYVTMLFTSDDIPEDYLKAMEIIERACEIMFKGTDSASSMALAHQKAFASELFNNRIQTKKQLDTWIRNTATQPKPPFRVVAISTHDTSEKTTLSYIQKTLGQTFPYQLAIIQHNVLFILQYNINILIEDKNTEKATYELFKKFNAFCGISNTFNDLLHISDYQIQAQDAMTLGKKTCSKYHVYFYEDFYLPAILAPRIEQMPRANYISPIITAVRHYDQKHSTDLFYTLDVYIKNLCSTTETANKLHIHRNSLLYRINKIEEITHSSLKEYNTFMHLLISFYMMEYQNIED